jgi:chromate transporter
VTPATPATPSRVHRLFEVMRYFLWLGVTGFGGPVALCGMMERDLVEQREWLDKSQMRDVIAVCQTMPGPLAVQVATFVGYMRCGIWGAWASGWALISPTQREMPRNARQDHGIASTIGVANSDAPMWFKP